MLSRPACSLALVIAVSLPVAARAEPDTFGTGNGQDGVLVVANGTKVAPNSVSPLALPAFKGDTGVALTATSGYHAGGLVMFIQALAPLTGSSPQLGDQRTINIDAETSGQWEFARISSVAADTSTGALTLALTAPLLYPYAVLEGRLAYAISVPEYAAVTVATGATLSGTGIVAMLVQGRVVLDGLVDVHGVGTRGGTMAAKGPDEVGCTVLDGMGGARGPSLLKGLATIGEGNAANAGGGGNCRSAGGGGGGHGGQGGNGGHSVLSDGDRDVGGRGGAPVTYAIPGRLLTGAGGGAGAGPVPQAEGGAGGGVVFVRALAVLGCGAIDASGEAGGHLMTAGKGEGLGTGGGGAGGLVYLEAAEPVLLARVSARGGDGGTTDFEGGAGGGGGGGRVKINAPSARIGSLDVGAGAPGLATVASGHGTRGAQPADGTQAPFAGTKELPTTVATEPNACFWCLPPEVVNPPAYSVSPKCPATASLCERATQQCVTCRDNSACPAGTPLCSAGACVECTLSDKSRCSANRPMCLAGLCGCSGDSDCSGNAPVCDTSNGAGRCVECKSTDDCTKRGVGGACDKTGMCTCALDDDSTCGDATSARVCGSCAVETSPFGDQVGVCRCTDGCRDDGKPNACGGSLHCGNVRVVAACAKPAAQKEEKAPVKEAPPPATDQVPPKAGVAPEAPCPTRPVGACLECTLDAHCPAAKPFCSDNACVPCLQDRDCSGTTPSCSLRTHACVACGTTSCKGDSCEVAACPDGAPVCLKEGARAGACVVCSSLDERRCAAPSPVCDDATHSCVPCIADKDCGHGPEAMCDPRSKTCVGCVAASDCRKLFPWCDPQTLLCEQCKGDGAPSCPDPKLPACHAFGACVECTETNTTACTADKPVCDFRTDSCVQCLSREDCGGVTPVCDTRSRTCRACAEDGAPECPEFERSICAKAGEVAGSCVACTKARATACQASGTTCDEQTGACRCLKDADCTSAAASSCDVPTGRCFAKHVISRSGGGLATEGGCAAAPAGWLALAIGGVVMRRRRARG